MNKSYALIAIATFAAIASTGVRAETFAAQTESTRSRAEVMAEAVTAVKTFSTIPAGSRVAAPGNSTRSRAEVMAEAVTTVKTFSNIPSGSRVAAPGKSAVPAAVVRGEAAQALRMGKIRSGELTGLEG